MANTQYKFKKSTFSYDGTNEVVAGSNKIENGDIVIALNDKNSPETARMYVKNPFGAAYGTDGDLFPIGTNVDSLTTTKGVKVGTHLRVEGTSKFDGEIDTDSTIKLTDQQANKSNTITSNSISFTGQSNDNAATISSDKSLTFNANGYSIVMGSSGIRLYNSSESILFEGDTSHAVAKLTAGNGLYVGTGYASIEMPDSDPYVNINGDTNITGSISITGDTSITGMLAVSGGATVYSLTTGAITSTGVISTNSSIAVQGVASIGSRVSIGDGVAPAVNDSGVSTLTPGIHVWHDPSNKGVSITGGGPNVYPQIIIFDNQNNEKIRMNGYQGDITAYGTIRGAIRSGSIMPAVPGNYGSIGSSDNRFLDIHSYSINTIYTQETLREDESLYSYPQNNRIYVSRRGLYLVEYSYNNMSYHTPVWVPLSGNSSSIGTGILGIGLGSSGGYIQGSSSYSLKKAILVLDFSANTFDV